MNRTRGIATVGILAIAIASAIAAFRFWRPDGVASEDGRPEVYDFLGDHPGDLAVSVDVADNVSHYGISHDIPYRFSTDTLGFRKHGSSHNGGPRILVLGDSFAFGMGVNDPDTFPARLELALAPSAKTVRVFNAAVPGYTITDQLEQWRAKLARFPVDLVLLCHTASDLKEMARPTSFRRFMVWDDETPTSDPEVQTAVARYPSKREAAGAEWAVPESELLGRLGAGANAAFAGYQAAWLRGLEALHGEIRHTQPNARLVLVLWVRRYGQGGLDTGPALELAHKIGIPVFDGQTALDRSGILPERLYLPDKHFSPEGNQLAAAQTARFLVGEFALLPHP